MVLGLVWFWVSFGLFSDFCYLVFKNKAFPLQKFLSHWGERAHKK